MVVSPPEGDDKAADGCEPARRAGKTKEEGFARERGGNNHKKEGRGFMVGMWAVEYAPLHYEHCK